MKIDVSIAANREIRSAARYYHAIHASLSTRIIDDFQRILTMLQEHPEAYRESSRKDVRVASMRSFPYEVYYQIQTAERIRVLNVLPARMSPTNKSKKIGN